MIHKISTDEGANLNSDPNLDIDRDCVLHSKENQQKEKKNSFHRLTV